MIRVPAWIQETFDNYLVCGFTTIKNDKPVTLPLLPFYLPDTGNIAVTSSILFSKKIEHMKQNPKVSVLFSTPKEQKRENTPSSCRESLRRTRKTSITAGKNYYLTGGRKSRTSTPT